MDYYTGEIRIFCGLFSDGSFQIADWYICNGAELSIGHNPSLYSVIKDRYNLPTTPPNAFRLPDLGGSIPIGAGQGPGLSNYPLGSTGGSPTYILNNLPSHNHSIVGATAGADKATPAGNLTTTTGGREGDGKYSNATLATPPATLNVNTIGPVGVSAPVSNMQPYLVLNYLICANGING